MNEQKKQKLLEQYDDAAFALLMDEYAEEEGARLMAEFEAAQAAGQVPQMPAELDEQCRRMIRRDRAKKRGKQAARSFRKVAVKAAVAVLVFIGLITTVVMSVDALRVPVLNFILTKYEEYSSIDINNHQDITIPETNPFLLGGLLPDDFYLVNEHNDGDSAYSSYKNSNGNTVQFLISHADGVHNIDTEGAETAAIDLGSYEALMIEKNGYRIVWYDDSIGILYDIRTNGIEKDEFISICSSLAQCYTNFPLTN